MVVGLIVPPRRGLKLTGFSVFRTFCSLKVGLTSEGVLLYGNNSAYTDYYG